MELISVSDPAEFLRRVDPLWRPLEARNSVIFGTVGALQRYPDMFPESSLWVVEHAERIVAAATSTSSSSLRIGDSADPAATRFLAAELSAGHPGLSEFIGITPAVDDFLTTWREHTRVRIASAMDQGVFRLEEVCAVAQPDGHARPARLSERDLLVDWVVQFSEEVFGERPENTARVAAGVERDLGPGDDAGFWVWDRGGDIAAMSGHTGPTPRGIRVNAVYTPPGYRRHGYATALVAAQSRWLLNSGRKFCFLYTDLANPTSNAIYRRIGYEQVGVAKAYRLVPK